MAAAATVKFTPLCGAQDGALCSLLQIGDFCLLLDCGWDETFDVARLEPLRAVAPRVNAILLSHSDIEHLGALPYAFAKLGLGGTVYCTLPVNKMGHLLMYDHCSSRMKVSDFDLFSLADVDEAFQNSIQLKYSQPQELGEAGAGITITPYAAGHSLGGTLWKITKDTEDIIYAVDYNHRKDKHLNETVLPSFVRPTLLISDAANALGRDVNRKVRDADFLGAITRTLQAGGNVLLPVDTAGRVLELLLYLDQHWEQEKLSFPLVLLTAVAPSTLDFARSFLEWMSDTLAKTFDATRANAFDLKHVTVMVDSTELASLPQGPCLVLASMASLETSFARQLFIDWAPNPANLIMFTGRGPPGSLARMLQVSPPPALVSLHVTQKVPLEGEELAAFKEEEVRKREEEAEALRRRQEEEEAVRVQQAQQAEEANEGGISQGQKVAEDPESAKPAEVASPVPWDVEMAPAQSEEEAGDSHQPAVFIDGFEVPPNAKAPMFPYPEPLPRCHEYGEAIDPEDFARKDDDMRDSVFQVQPGGDLEAIEDEDLLQEGPSKVVHNDIQLLDFESRSDGRSMRTILGHVNPLKLILIHGSTEATEALKGHLEGHTVGTKVQAPGLGEEVDVTSDLSAFKVVLTEELLQNVSFKTLGEYEVAWLSGQIAVPPASTLQLAARQGERVPRHSSIFVGDLKLADFKGLLKRHDIEADFAGGGGVLRCGDSVAVKKSSGQHVVMEGALSPDYYKIRELLYSQFFVL